MIFTRTLDNCDHGRLYYRVKVTVNTDRALIKTESYGFEENGKPYAQIKLQAERVSYCGMETFARYADTVYYGNSDGYGVLSALESIKAESAGLL